MNFGIVKEGETGNVRGRNNGVSMMMCMCYNTGRGGLFM
jgi:hypothetical protein